MLGGPCLNHDYKIEDCFEQFILTINFPLQSDVKLSTFLT